MNVKCDNDLPPQPIYLVMRVMLTQNRHKSIGAVNGQSG